VIRRRIIRRQPTKIWITANHQIKAPELRVLDERGENLGVMSTSDALNRAHMEDKDLILVTAQAQPPVAKIIEISKYKYQAQQKVAESRKHSKSQDTKEMQFKPFMGEADLQYRLKRVIEFLEDGDKVKPYVRFKGRQMTKKEFGFDIMKKIADATADIARIESPARFMGQKIEMLLVPVIKKKEETKEDNGKL
jgi:translation initiation factor IF-3